MYAPQAAFFSELFGTSVRYTGASVGYQLASIFAGALAPIIAVDLLGSADEKNTFAVAVYVALASVITVIAVWFAKETKRHLATPRPSGAGRARLKVTQGGLAAPAAPRAGERAPESGASRRRSTPELVPTAGTVSASRAPGRRSNSAAIRRGTRFSTSTSVTRWRRPRGVERADRRSTGRRRTPGRRGLRPAPPGRAGGAPARPVAVELPALRPPPTARASVTAPVADVGARVLLPRHQPDGLPGPSSQPATPRAGSTRSPRGNVQGRPAARAAPHRSLARDDLTDPDEPEAHALPGEATSGTSATAPTCRPADSVYLEGGVPPGGKRTNPGAREQPPPRRSVPVDLPGALYFAGDSPQWGGGVAFYDHDGEPEGAPTAARAYLITAQQFADMAAQEMYRVPQEGDPLVEVVLGGHRRGAAPRRSRSLRDARGGGPAGGAPMLLFTSPHGIDHVEHTQPSAAYLGTLATGCRSRAQWDDEEVSAYFDRLGVVRRLMVSRTPR